MKYEEAKAIGLELGLTLPAEFVNNVFIHLWNLIPYGDVAREQRELIDDARMNGVRFSAVCGDAILDGDSEDEPCYVCRAINEATQ